jgi:hypothetical protein
MSIRHADRLRQILGQGPCSASQIDAACPMCRSTASAMTAV